MFESNCPPLEAIAHEERITASYATRLVRLAFLAPDIVAAILAGKQPPGLTANKLMADTRLPLDWLDAWTDRGRQPGSSHECPDEGEPSVTRGPPMRGHVMQLNYLPVSDPGM